MPTEANKRKSKVRFLSNYNFYVYTFITEPLESKEELLDFDYDDDTFTINDDSTIGIRTQKTQKSDDPAKCGDEYITAKAFLRFLQVEQKERKASLSGVKELFERLNAITHAPDLREDGVNRGNSKRSFSEEYITKREFFDYLRSDANDAFDPVKGELEYDDMTQPISAYWINSSHDTYLTKQALNDTNCGVDVSMYAMALGRGCRCLELDVWDGQGSLVGEPVIRFG